MSGNVARLSQIKDFAWFAARHSVVDDPEGFTRDLESLGPTFIKLGQLLSTRPDLLPQAYVDALSRLQDDVEPFSFADVERILQEELGVRLSKAFVAFDAEPLAAASLGQVHRATLRGGREVAVKVQRPDIRERVLRDLDSLQGLATLLARFSKTSTPVDTERLVGEFRRSLLAELDYREEARNLVKLATDLGDFNRIVVPLPVDDFTTSRVLTMDFIPGTKVTKVSPVEWTEIDGHTLADDLFRAYLQQVLIDGTFHADPHPGNVLLTPDHRIALLDLGMVGRLSSTVQERIMKLLLAISEGRGDDAATAAIGLAETREEFDEAGMRRAVVQLVARYSSRALKELSAGSVMLEMARSGNEHGLRMAPELALLGKTLLNLDEIGRVLDPDFDVNASLRRNATSLMRRRMLKSASPAHVFTSMLEVREFAERLPGRVNRILDALAGNDLRLKVEVIDHGSIIDGLQKVANRIALGVVLAALIIGAAMLMRVPTSFMILGYPGFAMLLFLVAAAGGFWMAWTILMKDVRRSR